MIQLQEWDTIWARVSRRLNAIAASVQAARPHTRVTLHGGQTTFFPFGATLSISRNDSSEEDLVVSVNGYLNDDQLRMTADIARGGGYVLADGPELHVAASEAVANLVQALEPWLTELDDFLVNQTSLLVQELE